MDDRRQVHGRVVLDFAAYLHAIDVGHGDIEDQQVGKVFARQIESLATRGRLGDFIAGRLEDPAEQRSGQRLIVGNQNPGRPGGAKGIGGGHPL